MQRSSQVRDAVVHRVCPRWGLVLALAALLAPAMPAHAFKVEAVVITADATVLPCPGSTTVYVSTGGTLEASDITAGKINVRLVAAYTVDDDLLDDGAWTVPGNKAAGTYVIFILEFKVECDGACHIKGPKGGTDDDSANLAAEYASSSNNYGELEIRCKKGAKVSSTTHAGDLVTVGDPLHFGAIIRSADPQHARQQRGSALLQLIGQNGQIQIQLANQSFQSLTKGVVLQGQANLQGLPPGLYRLALTVRDERGQITSRSFKDIQMMPP